MNKIYQEPITIINSETFVHRYIVQNQMNVNTINDVYANSKSCKILRYIYFKFNEHAKEHNYIS